MDWKVSEYGSPCLTYGALTATVVVSKQFGHAAVSIKGFGRSPLITEHESRARAIEFAEQEVVRLDRIVQFHLRPAEPLVIRFDCFLDEDNHLLSEHDGILIDLIGTPKIEGRQGGLYYLQLPGQATEAVYWVPIEHGASVYENDAGRCRLIVTRSWLATARPFGV